MDDALHPGRPRISTATALFIIKTMTRNSITRGWSCEMITAEVSRTPRQQPVSKSTVYNVLSQNGYGVFKRTVKPGLTNEMKAARLKWCRQYED